MDNVGVVMRLFCSCITWYRLRNIVVVHCSSCSCRFCTQVCQLSHLAVEYRWDCLGKKTNKMEGCSSSELVCIVYNVPEILYSYFFELRTALFSVSGKSSFDCFCFSWRLFLGIFRKCVCFLWVAIGRVRYYLHVYLWICGYFHTLVFLWTFLDLVSYDIVNH